MTTPTNLQSIDPALVLAAINTRISDIDTHPSRSMRRCYEQKFTGIKRAKSLGNVKYLDGSYLEFRDGLVVKMVLIRQDPGAVVTRELRQDGTLIVTKDCGVVKLVDRHSPGAIQLLPIGTSGWMEEQYDAQGNLICATVSYPNDPWRHYNERRLSPQLVAQIAAL